LRYLTYDPAKITLSFIACGIPVLLSIVFPASLVLHILLLSLLIAPGTIILSFAGEPEFDAKNLAKSLIMSLIFLYVVSISYIYLFRTETSFQLFLFFILVALFVAALTKSFYRNRLSIGLNEDHYDTQSRIYGISIDKILVLFLVAIIVFTFVLALLNTPFGCLADNDSYTYIATGKELFNNGPSVIKWQELTITLPNMFHWVDGKYQSLYNGIDRLGFDLLEGVYGKLAGFTTESGQILAVFFYSLLPLATYLVSTTIVRKRSAIIAAILVNFIPFILWYSNRILTEIPMTIFMLFSIYFLIDYTKYRKFSDLIIFLLSFLVSLFMKPLAIVLVIPFLIFFSLKLFPIKSEISRKSMFLWLILWGLPFLGFIFLTRFRTGGSFRILLSSFVDSGRFIQVLQNNFSPYFVLSTLLILGLIGIPLMFTRHNWKSSALVSMSIAVLLWLVLAIGLLEPREGIMVYALIAVSVASFFEMLLLEKRVKSLFAILPILSIAVGCYLYYSLNGSIRLSPGFTISQSEALVQIVFFCAVFSSISLFLGFAFLRQKGKRLIRLRKCRLDSKIWSYLKHAMIVLCISLIIAQGFFEQQTLIQGGTLSNISLQDISLNPVANYINNLSKEGVLLTTLMASAPLNYLTSFKTIQPPPTLQDFYSCLNKQDFDYLVLIPSSNTLWFPRPDYLESFIYTPPTGMHEVYRANTPLAYNYNLTENDILSDWAPHSSSQLAFINKRSLGVDGVLDSGISSVQVLNVAFKPALNITCRMYLSPNLMQYPQVAWSSGSDYVAVCYQDHDWVLESYNNGTTSYAYKSLNMGMDINEPFNVTLSVQPTLATLSVNDNELIVTQINLNPSLSGKVILRSNDDGCIQNIAITTNATSWVIYERNGFKD
jgi:hypothetical protein